LIAKSLPLNHNHRQMDLTNKPSRPNGKPIGQSGTQIYSGFITGEEYNLLLTGKTAIRQYEIMRRSDATVRALIQVCSLPVIQADWHIESASEDPADKDVSGFVNNELFNKNINFTDFIRQALGMLTFGFSVFEKVFDPNAEYDGKPRIGLAKLGFRKQVSILRWQMEDGSPGVTQQLLGELSSALTASIPADRLVIFTNDREGDNYEGISLLRYCYKDWDLKDKLSLVMAIGLEKAAIPTPVLTVPTGANQTDVDNAIENLRQLRANEESYIKKPEGWTIDKLDMAGQDTKEILPFLRYCDRNILAAGLAQFLSLGSDTGSGSRALSVDQTRLFEKALEAVVLNIQSTIQKYIIDPLCELNFTDLKNGTPKLRTGRIADDDIAAKSEAINKLVTAGTITNNFETENSVRKTLGIPALPDDYKKEYDANAEAKRTMSTDPPATDTSNPKPDTKLPPTSKKEKLDASIREARRIQNKLIQDIVAV